MFWNILAKKNEFSFCSELPHPPQNTQTEKPLTYKENTWLLFLKRNHLVIEFLLLEKASLC